MQKFNFITPIVFETPAIWLAKSIFAFVALIDMKLHAQNELYTSISFWDIKVLKASLGMLGHASTHPPKLTLLIHHFNRYETAWTKSTFYLLKVLVASS